MSDAAAVSAFVVGLPARTSASAAALSRARGDVPAGFTPADLIARIEEAFSGKPKHFHPADRDADPTAGWNPLDPDAPPNAFLDPIAAARKAGHAEGLAAAARAQGDAATRDTALLTALTAELQQAGRIDREALARQLRQTVLLLVAKLVGETGVSAELLASRVHAAVELLADGAEAAILRVHPDDVALLDGRLPDPVFPVGDASVARGSFVLEAASTVVDDGPALWLEQLAATIDRIALPPLAGEARG